MQGQKISAPAVSWLLVMLACSLCRSCRNESLRSEGNDDSGVYKKPAIVRCQIIIQYLCTILAASLYVVGCPLCVSLLILDNTGPLLVSLCTWANLVLLKARLSTCRSKEISSLCLMLESLNKAYGSCTHIHDLHLIVESWLNGLTKAEWTDYGLVKDK